MNDQSWRRVGWLLEIILGFALAGAGSAANAASLDNWHWRNPQPFSDSVRSSCFGAGKFVAVGDGGVIHTSSDGVSWDEGRRPAASGLWRVIYAGGLFVAVGQDGLIATSSDGYSWARQSSGTSSALYSVAYGNGKYVACGEGGVLTISTNGSAWVPGTVGTNDLSWITFGNGLFLLPAPNVPVVPPYTYYMAVRTSADGHAWTTQTFPLNSTQMYPSVLCEAVFANGLFIASADVEWPATGIGYYHAMTAFTSSDATNWTKRARLAQGPNYVHRFLTAATGTFSEVCSYTDLGSSIALLASTADGTTVSTVQLPTEATDASSLTFASGQYVLTGLNGKVWTSTTGTNWTKAYGSYRNSLSRVIHGADRYLAVGNGVPILSSLDGVTFSPLPGSPSLAYGDIAFDGTNYVVVAAGGVLYTSNDGTTWVQRTSNTADALLGLCRGASRWVAVGHNGTVITSPNTLAWTLRASATANTLSGVSYGNGLYVAVGDGGTIITSTDGAAWDVQFSGTTNALTRVRFLDGQFLAVGASGTLLNSTNGTDWQMRNSAVARALNDVTFGDGRFVACGADYEYRELPDSARLGYVYLASANVLVQSTNGVTWEDITTKVPAGIGLNSVGFLDGSFWLCGENGALLQSDSIDGLPRLAAAMQPSGFQVRLTLNVPSTCRVQALTNLDGDSWQDVGSITNPVVPVWTDSSAPGLPRRLYRIVSP